MNDVQSYFSSCQGSTKDWLSFESIQDSKHETNISCIMREGFACYAKETVKSSQCLENISSFFFFYEQGALFLVIIPTIFTIIIYIIIAIILTATPFVYFHFRYCSVLVVFFSLSASISFLFALIPHPPYLLITFISSLTLFLQSANSPQFSLIPPIFYHLLISLTSSLSPIC